MVELLYVQTLAYNWRLKIAELSGKAKPKGTLIRTEGYIEYSQGQRIDGEKI